MSSDASRAEPTDGDRREQARPADAGPAAIPPGHVAPVRSHDRREKDLVDDVVDAVKTLRPSSAQAESDERVAERASRVILSALGEPGDGVLGDLLLEYGPTELLDRLWVIRTGDGGPSRPGIGGVLTRARDGGACARVGIDGVTNDRGSAGPDVAPVPIESGRCDSGMRSGPAHCDSSSRGRARDWNTSLSASSGSDAASRDDVLDLFRSEEWAMNTGLADVPPRIRGRNRGLAARSVSGTDAALKGVPASVETWRRRLDRVEQILNLSLARTVGAQLLIPGDDDWPLGVADLGRHAPIVLWVRGTASDLNGARPAVALVGARACSPYGQQVATEAAWHLARRGVALFSGGAYGIDGAVHRAAIRAGGRTVAFLAGGVDRLYPAGHHGLLESIIDSGALVSEVPCGTTPTKWRFLQRNRLIAAASQATVVVEAGSRSGSLNTAGHAAHLGRPLGAVPGPVTTAHSIGCHRLLRDYDATCVTSGDEMLQLVEPLQTAVQVSPGQQDASRTSAASQASAPASAAAPGSERHEDDEPRARRLIDALSARTPRRPLDLARRSGLSERDVVAELGALQLRGAAKATGGGWLYVPRAQR
jgi:DNA processing protein